MPTVALLRGVDFWPSDGPEDELWTDDAATDAWVRTACQIAEAFSAALVAERLEGPCSGIRFFSHPRRSSGKSIRLQVDTRRPDGSESAVVLVPTGVEDLPPQARARLVLDVVHRLTIELAPHRGWAPAALDRVRDAVLATDLTFSWGSPWKASPDRTMQARTVFRITDEGQGRGLVEVRARDTEELLARTGEQIALNSSYGFGLAARTLRWRGRTLTWLPCGPYGATTEPVVVDPGTCGIAPPVSRPDEEPAGALPSIELEPYGHLEDDPTPGVRVYETYGIAMDSDGTLAEGEPFGARVESELHRRLHESVALTDWVGDRELVLWLSWALPGRVDDSDRPIGLTLRGLADRVTLRVVRDASVISPERVTSDVLRAEAAAIAEEAMTAIHRRAAGRQR